MYNLVRINRLKKKNQDMKIVWIENDIWKEKKNEN